METISTISIKDLMDMSYSEVQKLYMEGWKFSPIVIKEYVEVQWENIKDLTNTANALLKRQEFYRKILFEGKLSGYKIKCPECGIIYEISCKDLNRTPINCMDCGHEYLQTENISSIVYYKK